MGIFGLVMITAPAIGPTLSGWILEHYSWRMLFSIVLPFSILTLVYAFFKLRNITPNRDVKLDVFSLVLSSIGFGGFFTDLVRQGIWAGTRLLSMERLLLGQLRSFDSLFDNLRWTNRCWILGFINIRCSPYHRSSRLSFGRDVFGDDLTPLYVQTFRGISPLDSGILMLPGAISWGLCRRLRDDYSINTGRRAMAIVGLSLQSFRHFT